MYMRKMDYIARTLYSHLQDFFIPNLNPNPKSVNKNSNRDKLVRTIVRKSFIVCF